MNPTFSINVFKQYFNFSASHFLVFGDGTREPLHGHNWRVKVKAYAPQLEADMVFDFLNIKPLVRKACDELDHCLLLPRDNPFLKIVTEGDPAVHQVFLGAKEVLRVPAQDVLILPIPNTSAERLAIHLANRIYQLTVEKFKFHFSQLEVEVEETPGQSATFSASRENYGIS